MNAGDLAQSIAVRFRELVVEPLRQFSGGLEPADKAVLFVLLAVAAVAGFLIGRRGGRWALRSAFQNRGEALVSHVLMTEFGPPDYHLLNHVTIRMEDGTTEVDHILVSRFGVFVIETKDYSGWIFGRAGDTTWTQVRYKWRSTFQNPIFQNRRHVRAVQGLLDFLPPDAVMSVVVFAGDAEFKTEVPDGVVTLDDLVWSVRRHAVVVMSTDRLQFCVGRLETTRLAISGATDIEHIESLAQRHGASGR